MAVTTFENANGIMDRLESEIPDAIITDIRMPGMDGLQLMDQISEHYPELPVIIITAHSDLDSAVSAYQGGAFEYLPKPFDVDEAIELVNRAVQHSQSKGSGEATITHEEVPEIIGEAASMQEVFRAIGRLARSKITVLINGESGTGKELVAQALLKMPVAAVLNRPMAAPCSWMKLVTCLPNYKRVYYVFWPMVSSIESVDIPPKKSMSALLPLLTRTWNNA